MTILLTGGHTYHLSLVGQAIQQKNDEEALRLLTSGYLVPFDENGLGTLQQIILRCFNPKLLEAVIEELPAGKINAIDSTGDNALITAAKCRNIAAINLLVAAKADVNLSDEEFQQTPLHQVMNRSSPLNHVRKATVLETVQCLLKHGASMEIPDKFGKTALQTYIYTSDYDSRVISLLISEGDEPPYAMKARPANHALQLSAAIQTGLALRRTEVIKSLTSHFSVPGLLALINEYV